MTHQPQPVPCTASIENEHTHGRQHCTRPAGHTTSHASPPIAGEGIAGQAGRIYWDDASAGAVTHQSAAVSAAVTPPTNHGLSLPHADALYDAIATPGPKRESFDEQYANVCRVVRQILDELLPTPAEPADRATVLHEVADELTRKANKLTERVHDLAYFVAKDRLREAEILDREATALRRMADETATDQPQRATVQHAPGKAIRCPDCRAKGYTVCLDEPAAGARQDETATETPKEQ